MKSVYIERFGSSEVLIHGDRPRAILRTDVLIEVHATEAILGQLPRLLISPCPALL